MRSTMTTTVSLRQALLDAAQQMSAGHTARLRVIENGTPRELHPIVREEAGRIASEAMLNALRHANATAIDVELFYERKHLRICIRDDGRGMETSMAAEGRDGHFGLLGMRERAKRIRGRLTVWSRVGAGTEVSLIVPARMAYDRGNSNTRRLPNNRESSE
jgi:signal transduction histidine kinase